MRLPACTTSSRFPEPVNIFSTPWASPSSPIARKSATGRLRLMKIEWEELPFILDMEESAKTTAAKTMPEAQRVKEKAREPNTVIADDVTYGNLEKGFAEADKIIEYKIRRETNSAAGVEAAAVVAQWRGDFLDLWVHHQDIPQWFLINPQDTRGKHIPPLAEWSKITVTMPFQGALFGGFSWLVYSQSFTRLAVILARRADGRPVRLIFDDSNLCTLGDDAGTYAAKSEPKRTGRSPPSTGIWLAPGIRPSKKRMKCTKIPNIRGSQEWPCQPRAPDLFPAWGALCVPHNVMFDRVAAEFGLDPTEVALKNDGCRATIGIGLRDIRKKTDSRSDGVSRKSSTRARRPSTGIGNGMLPERSDFPTGKCTAWALCRSTNGHWGAGMVMSHRLADAS